MKQTVIPAQITTVEDKIAGSLNLTQILLLLCPLFISTFIYAVIPVSMHFTMYKMPFILMSFLICTTLSLRIKGKIVLNWLIILLRFNLRPKFYVFNKNDSYLRDIDFPVFEKTPKKASKKKVVSNEKTASSSFEVSQAVLLENLISNKKVSLSIKEGRKGGLSVAFEKVQK